MEMILEIIFDKFWILAERLDVISRMGRRVIITGNQIRQLARRGRNRFSRRNDSEDDMVRHREAFKRLHTGQLAEEARRMAMYREAAMALDDIDVYLDCKDNISDNGLVQASNGGNLYGGNGTTGTTKTASHEHLPDGNEQWPASNDDTDRFIDSPDGSFEDLDPAVILARQGWDVYKGSASVGATRNANPNSNVRISGKKRNGGARRLLTLGNISIVDSSDSE